MTRLFIVTPFGERLGGSDNILLTFLRNLDRSRFEPFVAFLGEGGFEREVRGLGIRTAALPSGRMRQPLHLAATVRRVVRLIRAERPDLILNWLSTAHVYGGPAAAIAGMRDRCLWWQLDLHGRGASRGRLLDRVATLIPARAVGGCSEAVAAAQAQLRPRRKTFAVLPGIDPPQPLAEQELAHLREGIGIPTDRVVIGIVGRLFSWKGHHNLLRALAMLRDRGHPVHGLVVGGGGHRGDERYETSLRELVKELSLDGAVTFTGQVPDATGHIQLMDVFVNASAGEPFGLVLLEAMALGVPVVAVAAAGPAEIVEPDRSGVLAASNAPGDLAQAVRGLLDDPAGRRQMAERAQEVYRERFTGARMTREMERRLSELLP